MSLRTMPILFLNMGGEMIYILDQRLQAQNVKADKSIRVMSDIVGTMFSNKFLDEIFKPQMLYSRKGMRALFEKLAHASIMRLNATSMDKLFDLMTMACKYHLQHCVSPKDLLLVTLNHLDGVRKLVQNVEAVCAHIDHAYNLLRQHLIEIGACELAIVKSTLLGFYQDARVKVSLLLREKKQNEDGRFVFSAKQLRLPFGGQMPGTIKIYVKGQLASTNKFPAAATYNETKEEGSLAKIAKKGERVITLGTNIYKGAATTETQGGQGSVAAKSEVKEGEAADELRLLTQLINISGAPDQATNFSLSLFDNPDDESAFAIAAQTDEGTVVKIDASKKDKRDINKMVGNMDVGKDKKTRKAKGDELLDLMDSTDK